jgi:prolyl-tRNA synthetase
MYNYSSLVPLKSALSVHSLGKYYTGAVMGIGHIFKIDDRYTNIDRWSMIADSYLLNVFTDYNYSNSLYFKSMLDKSKDLNKIVSYLYKL